MSSAIVSLKIVCKSQQLTENNEKNCILSEAAENEWKHDS